LANPIPIVQVVGGDPVPVNSPLLTGYHINAAGVGVEHVQMLNELGVKLISVLLDYSSETTARVFNAVEQEADKNGIVLNPIFARNPGELKKLSEGANPVDTSFMLIPSGMFFQDANMQYIVSMVDNAGDTLPAIYPEREYKIKHSDKHKPHIKVHGHHISQTYLDSADLVNSIFGIAKGAPLPAGGEAAKDDF
jgi:hypothetical protein